MGLAWVLGLALGSPIVAAPALPGDEVPPVTPASVELTWNAPPDCGSAQEVQSRIAELLTAPPSGNGEAKVVADVERDADGVRMTLAMTFAGATDVREVTSSTCDALTEATALLLAVSLEPGLEPEPGPVSEPEADPVTTEAAPPVEVLLPPPVLPDVAGTAQDLAVNTAPEPGRTSPGLRPRALRLYGLAAAGVEWGAVQDVTGALRLGLGIGGRAWAAEVLGTYLLPRRQPEGLFQVGLAGVRGCWTPGAEVWRALLCAGGDFGGLRVDSRGVEPRRTQLGPHLGPVASVGVLRHRGRVGFVLRAEAMVRAVGSQTVDESEEVLTEQRVVSLRLSLGLQFDLVPPRG